MVDVRVSWLTVPKIGHASDREILSAAERARADRFVRREDAVRYEFVRASLRRHLSDLIGQSPERIAITVDDHGKPRLTSGGVHFNVSHSHDVAVIAICVDVPVGVDVERIQPVEAGLVDQVFSPEEHAAFARIPEPEQAVAFVRCWCRKEALLKGLGVGLTLPMESIAVSLGEVPVVLRSALGEVDGWQLEALTAAEGYEAALAVRADGLPVRLDIR